MAIKFLMVLYIFTLLLASSYMWRHRASRFLIFDTKSQPRLSFLLQVTAMLLLAIAIIGSYILFTQNKEMNLLTLASGAFVILLFGLFFSALTRNH